MFKNLNDKNEEIGDLMCLPKEEIPQKLLLCYAYTYHKSQARTIHGSIRLTQTQHKNSSQRHLIVGLRRAPNGLNIQVV